MRNNNTSACFLKSLLLLAAGLLVLSLTGCEEHFFGVLNPKGLIAEEGRKLFFDTLALMLIVVLPVIIMSFTFVYHYQVSHRIREYKPNWAHSYFLETLWWGIPCIIIVVLAVITWRKTFELDPYRKIPGLNGETLRIQAIALPWKWLFIYPDYGIATVNYLVLPLGQQVEYWITADNVPMSAFFIPQLGSQIYAMSGMRTRLHLVADHMGEFNGLNTQYNGEGFSDMHFPVLVVMPYEMQKWIAETKKSPQQLNEAAYTNLLNPVMNASPQFFSGVAPNLFENAVAIYMHTVGTIHPRSQDGKFYQSTE